MILMAYDFSARHRLLRDDKRSRAIEYLGGSCVECRSVEKLHFHHSDPEAKSFPISTYLLLSWERLVEELDKCELRCEDCHVSHHKSKYECGTPQRYWRGCRCGLCKAAMSQYNREYRARRNAS